MELSGIYAITNKINNKKYIGQSTNIEIRKNTHYRNLKSNKHTNLYLQSAFNKYGISYFTFEVIEYCNENELDSKEISYIEKYKTYDKKYGYNLTIGGKGFKKDLTKWTKIAKQLAQQNNGIIPNSYWLITNGYDTLRKHIKLHPELFNGMIQEDKTGKTKYEWLDIAKKLAEKNNNILPSRKWLAENGYIGLISCINKYPSLFNIFNQSNLLKTVEEWVTIVKELMENNNGKLPSYKWLRKNGYSSIPYFVKNYPEKFSFVIKHGSSPKSLNDHIMVCVNVLSINNNIFPSTKWLRDNGYSGTDRAIRNNPELFKDFINKRKIAS